MVGKRRSGRFTLKNERELIAMAKALRGTTRLLFPHACSPAGQCFVAIRLSSQARAFSAMSGRYCGQKAAARGYQ
jgi:hypothetical protein